MSIARVLHRIVGRGMQDLAVESAIDKNKEATSELRERLARLSESCAEAPEKPRRSLHESSDKREPAHVRLRAIKA